MPFSRELENLIEEWIANRAAPPGGLGVTRTLESELSSRRIDMHLTVEIFLAGMRRDAGWEKACRAAKATLRAAGVRQETERWNRWCARLASGRVRERRP